jgi:excisionase family DNA binding protein
MEDDERRESEKTARTGGGRASSGRTGQLRELALSTGQAARYCYVTSYTIVNWIHSRRLRAQKTAGGQYRIRVGDLREFMRANDMRTDLLEEEKDIRPYCWEFHCQPGEESAACESCLVRRSGAENCYELRSVISLSGCLFQECASCEYYKIWGPSENRSLDWSLQRVHGDESSPRIPARRGQASAVEE